MTSTLLPLGFALAVVVVLSRTLSQKTGLPYPVFLIVASSIASYVPHVPAIRLNPQLVFLGFLPPLVYHAGFVTSPRELRANALPIGLSALGLVLATTFAVAGAVFALSPSLGWASAFVLGAVVAPTDPVSATSVLKRLGGPPRITTILEGESLVNDGIALSLLAIGITAATSPTGIGAGFVAFVRVAGGGVVFGLIVGWLVSHIRTPLRDPSSQIVVSLLVPYAAYLPANALGLSGVLAALVTGLVLGQRPVAALQPAGRLRANAFWDVLVFLLESVLFILVGSQLRRLITSITGIPVRDVVLSVVITVVVVLVLRLCWQLAVPNLRFRPEGRLIDTGEMNWSERTVLGWSGLRGAISLAAALSIPVVVNHHRFPGRSLIVFATYCVILVTVIGQGTSLPWLLRRLGLVGSDVERRQHALAHRRCAEAAIRRLDELVAEDEISDEVAETLRDIYEHRLQQAREQADEDREVTDEQAGAPLRGVHRQLLSLQHDVVRQLHDTDDISFSVMLDVNRELDLEQASLES